MRAGRKEAAQRLYTALLQIWQGETPVHLMSFGIAALLEERHRIGAPQQAVEAIMNKELDQRQQSPEAVMWQKMILWRANIVEKALKRLAELEISEDDRALLREAITGQVEEASSPAIDPNTVYPDVLTTEEASGD